jgi:DNA adenine methylase
MSKPILKWAGGKTQLLKHIVPLIPKKINKYYEPFFGGGALFFNLMPKDYLISDINPELTNLYKTVSSYPNEIISELKKYPFSKEFFYKLRKLKHENLDEIKAACRMIYLNRTCFNGLYRVNKKGEFNVPFGNYKNPTIVQEERLLQASLLLNQNKIKTDSFEFLFNKKLKKKDFVFFDPPYIPVSKFSDFKRYNKEQFNLDQHTKLAELFNKLSNEGVPVVLTNSSSDIVKELYLGHNFIEVNAKRNINSKGESRKAKELIIYSNV